MPAHKLVDEPNAPQAPARFPMRQWSDRGFMYRGWEDWIPRPGK
jgi:hypothetical protein